MPWITEPCPDPVSLGLDIQTLPPLPAPAPDSRVLDDVPVMETGESLEDAENESVVFRAYRRLGFEHCPERLLLRQGVLARLAAARDALPPDVGLVLMDGWRPQEFQNELFEYYKRESPTSIAGYVADPSSTTLIPGHVTGGAVDLTLSYRGKPLAMGSDYDDFTPRAHILSLEDEFPASSASVFRRFMGRVLADAGFAPYPLEWWHWSYGDQRWAAQIQAPNAIYGEAVC